MDNLGAITVKPHQVDIRRGNKDQYNSADGPDRNARSGTEQSSRLDVIACVKERWHPSPSREGKAPQDTPQGATNIIHLAGCFAGLELRCGWAVGLGSGVCWGQVFASRRVFAEWELNY